MNIHSNARTTPQIRREIQQSAGKMTLNEAACHTLTSIRSTIHKWRKVSGGRYVSTDAKLIHSARRPRKRDEVRKELEGSYEMETKPVYADDKQARYVIKGGKLVDGYAATTSTDEQGWWKASRALLQTAVKRRGLRLKANISKLQASAIR